ncbi:MAG: SIS domain-containing protein [Phenylobacterium sp.]|uniref:D-sedoheptulose-7-phosphate isomerase n=1 Tax=Phenylobacterium sp. TaxID=1871053 RepID=UPI0025E3734D|nr:SIS domain-containing protein [Phenylobacterium sp.]MBI1198464.1 SIS domain-containing protein [Phenylobacterium sp.]
MTYFPDRLFDDAGSYATAYFEQYRTAAASVDQEALRRAGELVGQVISEGAAIYSCGNGGSAAIANHLACDCLKGIRTGTLLRPKVFSLSTTVELITAIANDISYDDVFAFQLESLAKPGDLLVAISSSGQSPNIVKALTWAKDNGLRTLAMTGFSGGASAEIADVSLHVAGENYGVVEDIHQSLMHLLAQYTRHRSLTNPSDLGRQKF